MNAFEVGACGGNDLQRDERVGDSCVVGTVDDRTEPLGAFGVATHSEVLEKRIVRREQDRHASYDTACRGGQPDPLARYRPSTWV